MSISISDAASIATIIGTILAIAAAIYGVYKFLKNRKPHLKVELNIGLPKYGEKLGDPVLLLKIANRNEKQVTLETVELVWPKRKLIVPSFYMEGERPLPYLLPPSDRLLFWLPLKDLEHTLQEEGAHGQVHLKARFRDTAGHEYLSNQYTLNVPDQTKA
jgi:hypothetical protein